jgi:hypothetical protein
MLGKAEDPGKCGNASKLFEQQRVKGSKGKSIPSQNLGMARANTRSKELGWPVSLRHGFRADGNEISGKSCLGVSYRTFRQRFLCG